jgi:hypothetical protein
MLIAAEAVGGMVAKAMLSMGRLAWRPRTGGSQGFSDPAIEPEAPIALTSIDARADTPPIDVALRLPKEVEALLREIGMPPCSGWTGKPSKIYGGKLRAPDTPEDAARRFVVWIRATEQTGEYKANTLEALYDEFCQVDHREMVPSNLFLGALSKTAGVKKQQLAKNDRVRTYTIRPARPAPKPKSATARKKGAARKAKAGNVVQLARAA